MVLFEITCIVALPPYKQTCADSQERKNQQERTNALKAVAQEQKQAIIHYAKVRLSVTYYRSRGRSDASNIIGNF